MKDDLRSLILPKIKKLEEGQKEGQRRFEKLEVGQEYLKKALERIEKKLEKMEKRMDTMTNISSLIQTLTLIILKNMTEKKAGKRKRACLILFLWEIHPQLPPPSLPDQSPFH